MGSIGEHTGRGHTVVYCHVSTSACQRRPCYTVSVERLLVSYFSRTWRRSSALHCRAMYAPSTPHFKWSDYPRPVSRLCGWSGQGRSRRKIATRSGSVRLTQTNSAGMPATNACAYALLFKIGIDTATAAL